MRIRHVCQLVLLTLTLVVAFQYVLTASAQDSSENTTPVSDNENNNSTPTAQLNIQGIWNVSLAGTGITVAVDQSGDSIYGRCKFEGAVPWNGVIAGLLSGNSVNIAIAAEQGEVFVSTDITGMISDDVLSGRYVIYDSDGNEVSGTVTGTRISPDVSDYTPVKVEAAAEPVPAQTPAEAQQPQAVQLAQPDATQDNQATKSKVKDVTQLARGINANILPWSFPL